MKQSIEQRNPEGMKDYIALALTTFGVGYIPLAPGTWGSAVGVAIYLAAGRAAILLLGRVTAHDPKFEFYNALIPAILSVLLLVFCLVGIWASSRTASLFGNSDPSQAVVDEVMGQLITFAFIPFTFSFVALSISWKLILAGFLLFRLFDIWKPYPIDDLQGLSAGLGICADDIVAGVYAGVCLAIIYAVSLSI